MTLIDDLREDLNEDEAARRRFLFALGGGALAVAGVGTLITSVRFMEPNLLFEPATRVTLGRPEDIPVGEVVVMPRQKLFVVHAAEGFYAMSAVCTHLGCMVRNQPEKETDQAFFCPCHGSRFDLRGNVVGGPAPIPLRRLELTVESGKLVVNLEKEVPEGTVTEV